MFKAQNTKDSTTSYMKSLFFAPHGWGKTTQFKHLQEHYGKGFIISGESGLSSIRSAGIDYLPFDSWNGTSDPAANSYSFVDIFKWMKTPEFKNFTFYNFDLKQNAILKNYKIDKIENTNVKYSFNNIEQAANSLSETFILSSGSHFFKNEINCNLNGKYSSAFINGIFSLSDDRHHEIRTTINHLTENTKSYQLIKSVLDDSSKAVYQGKIFVNSEAQKTDGYQLSKAILLNEASEFNAKPELEIYADDVKCSHGSASGSLDEDSIFYLMSRGLNYQQSRELLINGFLLDVIEKITDSEIKNLIKNTIGLKE